MKLLRIIGTTSITKAEIEQSRVCEFCMANINKTGVDIREFICVAPNQKVKWLSAGRKDEQRFIIDEPCLKSEQGHCFIWQDNKAK